MDDPSKPSGHLLHVTISGGYPKYRIECLDLATCDMQTQYEDPEKAKETAAESLGRTPEGTQALLEAAETAELDELLRDEWDSIADQPWPWVKADPPECWGEHVNEFADECETYDGFDWPGEITGPIRVNITNGGDIEDFMPEVTVADVPVSDMNREERAEWSADNAARRANDLMAENKTLRSVLRLLVDLKDGPRDEAYREAKGRAWESAREVLRRG